MGNCHSLDHHSHDHVHGAGTSCSRAHPVTKHPAKTDRKIILEYQGDGYNSGDTSTETMSSILTCEKYSEQEHSEKYKTLTSFSENDMPAGFKDAFKVIQVVTHQTCQIRVNYVSENRPSANYPLFEFRGMARSSVGSGCIHINNINMKDVTEWYYSTFSPATSDNDKKKVYGTFNIQTAKHVIFDAEEMKFATLHFFYDSEDKSQVVEGIPVEIVGSDGDNDRIDIKCVTLDKDFGERMKEVERERNQLWGQFTSRSRPHDQEYENNFIAVCISHPHDSFKRISIGKAERKPEGVSDRKDGGTKWSCFTYDTPTCKGSSGAPVWICNLDGSIYAMVPHSYHIPEMSSSHSALGAVHE